MALDVPDKDLVLRDAIEADWPAVLALNAAFVHHLSPMDAARLARLAAASCCFRVIESDAGVEAFLMAFAKGAVYDGAIFQLLSRRAEDFVYIDRIVVAERLRGKGLAERLYDDIVAYARSRGVEAVLCEVNVVPPNPTSRRFHERFGFREIGRHSTGAERTVALLAYDL